MKMKIKTIKKNRKKILTHVLAFFVPSSSLSLSPGIAQRSSTDRDTASMSVPQKSSITTMKEATAVPVALPVPPSQYKLNVTLKSITMDNEVRHITENICPFINVFCSFSSSSSSPPPFFFFFFLYIYFQLQNY